MKRFLILLTSLIFISLICTRGLHAQYKAQSWIFSTKISFADYSDKNDWDGYSMSKIPPIALSLEKGLTDFFSAGGYIGYYGNKYTNDTLSVNVMRDNTFVLGAIGSIHYAHWLEEVSNYKIFLGDFDFYLSGALKLGFNREKQSNMPGTLGEPLTNHKSNTVSLNLSPIVGFRYFLSDYFSMLLEFGKGNMGMITTGVSWQIGQ